MPGGIDSLGEPQVYLFKNAYAPLGGSVFKVEFLDVGRGTGFLSRKLYGGGQLNLK